MATRQRPADRRAERGRELVAALGREARIARRDRALSLRDVGAALGVSATTVWRAEHGRSPRISVHYLARQFAVVGLDLTARGFAGPAPTRAAGHGELLERFHERLNAALRWGTEVVFPTLGDQRRWDALVSGAGWRYGVEAEVGPQDAQALAGRLALKRRDGAADGVILLLPATKRVRAFLAAARPLLEPHFPISGVLALQRLAAGEDPGGSAIVVLRTDRRVSPRVTTDAMRRARRT